MGDGRFVYQIHLSLGHSCSCGYAGCWFWDLHLPAETTRQAKAVFGPACWSPRRLAGLCNRGHVHPLLSSVDLSDIGPHCAISEWGLMLPAALPQLLMTCNWHITKSNMISSLTASFSQEIPVPDSVESGQATNTRQKDGGGGEGPLQIFLNSTLKLHLSFSFTHWN